MTEQLKSSQARSARITILGEHEFRRLAELIQSQFGIRMPDHKKTMLQSRLQKRLRHLEMTTFREYCEYLFSDEGRRNELVRMVDAVTTNKTDFFREPDHFDSLTDKILPTLGLDGAGIARELRVWSAGCSTGEEPYTIAIVMEEYARTRPRFSYSVVATDVSERVLAHANEAVYQADKIDVIPLELKRRYFRQSKNKLERKVRVAPRLRQKVTFSKLNLTGRNFGITGPFDIIFCRNVIIYFDRETQERLFQRFCRYLGPGGYLIIGHSETLSALDVPLTYQAPTIYRKI